MSAEKGSRSNINFAQQSRLTTLQSGGQLPANALGSGNVVRYDKKTKQYYVINPSVSTTSVSTNLEKDVAAGRAAVITERQAISYTAQKPAVAAAQSTRQEKQQKRVVTQGTGASSQPTAVKTELPKPSDKANPPGREGIINQRDRTEVVGQAMSQTFNLNSFLSEVINNDVLPSHSYLVTFAPFRANFPENQALSDFVINKRSTLMMRCESVILPTPTLLEEENIRRYGYGPVEKVPYGVQFSDVSMTWLVDSKSEIIDFMHQWMNTIVMHDSPNANMAQNVSQDGMRSGLGNYMPFEVGYKDAYTNPVVRIYVYNRQQQTVTEYEMYDVFPMNIQSMNLSWADENQIQKLTVNFAYVNMRVRAPMKVKDQAPFDSIEALKSPYEERTQPTDKGGKAAADATTSPVGEATRSTANASKPNATESKQKAPTGVVVSPNSPQNKVLGP